MERTMMMGNREQLAELMSSLEQATLTAKQLGTAVELNQQLLQIPSSFHLAHHRLSAFLSTFPSAVLPEKSISSVEPMQLGEEENGVAQAVEEERDSAVEKVEEKMRECFIRNKRAKRPLSPSSAVVETSATDKRGSRDYGFDSDPLSIKLRAFDLIYQFHG